MTPDTAISERQLVVALAARGRMVCAADVAAWRKAGLLPPLASHGLGQGKGKVHCWHESDIVRQAQLVFDAMRQYGRHDLVLLLLFLSGFAVPLPQLRRAWPGRSGLCKPVAVRQTARVRRPAGLKNGDPLLETALAIGAAVQTNHPACLVPLLERALTKLGHARQGRSEQMIGVIMAMESALEASDLVGAAEDAEIAEAQHYLVLGLDFLRGCAERKDRDSLTAMFGPRLFVLILALLRSGQRTAIEHIAMQIEDLRFPATSVRHGPVVQIHAAE